MPNRIATASFASSATTNTIIGVDIGSANNRAVYVCGSARVAGAIFLTNVTYGATALSLMTNILQSEDTSVTQNLSLWSAYSVSETGSNSVVAQFSAAASPTTGLVVATYTDAATNGAIVFGQLNAPTTATNALTSATNRVALSFLAHAVNTTPTLVGTAGHTLREIVTNDNNNGTTVLTDVDPSVASVEMGFQDGLGDLIVASFDVQPPEVGAVTNVAFVGIG